MSEVKLSTFPSDRAEAIAYLYVQKKEYDNLTPELLAEEYMHAYEKIKPLLKKTNNIRGYFSNSEK